MPTLLTDVWSLVAQHLSLRDAALLTRVCKEASKLQLRYIEVKTGDERCYQHPRYSQPLVPQEQQTTCPEGLFWASRRWVNAQCLQLRLGREFPQDAYVDLRLGPGPDAPEWGAIYSRWAVELHALAATGLRNLDGLLLESSLTRKDVIVSQIFSTLLEGAKQLRVLQLNRSIPISLQSMQSLQHLILTFSRCEVGSSLSAIAAAPNLVTLLLTETFWESHQDDTDGGELNLSALSCLAALSLRYVLPAALSLPKHCRLAVKVMGLQDANACVWDSVREHIAEFHLRGDKVYTAAGFSREVLCDADQLPSFLFEGSPLEKVSLVFADIGSAENGPVHLGGSLADVQWLKLKSSKAIRIRVPEFAAWSHLKLECRTKGLRDAEDLFLLDFEGKGPFLQQHLSPKSFAYQVLQGKVLLESHRDAPSERLQPSFMEDSRRCMEESPALSLQQNHWGCTCACCSHCLQHAGKLTARWFDDEYTHLAKGWS